MVSEGTSCRQEVGGGVPLASATVFSTSSADYKQKRLEEKKKKGLALCKQQKKLGGKKRSPEAEFLLVCIMWMCVVFVSTHICRQGLRQHACKADMLQIILCNHHNHLHCKRKGDNHKQNASDVGKFEGFFWPWELGLHTIYHSLAHRRGVKGGWQWREWVRGGEKTWAKGNSGLQVCSVQRQGKHWCMLMFSTEEATSPISLTTRSPHRYKYTATVWSCKVKTGGHTHTHRHTLRQN